MISTPPSASYLSWGIKGSFRNYLSMQADFSLNVEEGAFVGAGNAVCFTIDANKPDSVDWAGLGHAIFRAHGGMMRLSLKNPVVRQKSDELVLAFDLDSATDNGEPDYFEVARLEEAPEAESQQRTYRAFLLPTATSMFNDMYDPHTELDPVIIAEETES